MSQLRNIGTILSSYSWNGSRGNNTVYCGDIAKRGYLAKEKITKKCFFVLRRETSDVRPARLEEYSSEQNFLAGLSPKKTYVLKNCFNISRKIEKKNHVIALYINKSCVELVAKDLQEMTEWLQLLQFHKKASIEKEGKVSRKDYDYVWQVKVLPLGLGLNHNLRGEHWLCYSDRVLTLVRVNNPEMKKYIVLSSVRSCHSSDADFFLEMGRISVTGPGKLGFQTKNTLTAKKIHNTIGSDMKTRRNWRFGEMNKKTHVVSPQNEHRPSDSWPSMKRIRNISEYARQSHTDGDATTLFALWNGFPNYAVKNIGYLDMDKLVPMSKFMQVQRHRKKLDGDYTPMDDGEKPVRPTTLSLLPTKESDSLASNSLGGNPGSLGINPVSPCFSDTSPMSISSQHSSMRSSDVEYVQMMSPDTQAPAPTHSATGASSPYLNMGPVPVQFAATISAQNGSQKQSDLGSC